MLVYYCPNHFPSFKAQVIKNLGGNLEFAVDFLTPDMHRIKAQPKKPAVAITKTNTFVRFSAHYSFTETHLTLKVNIALSLKKKKKEKETKNFSLPSVKYLI